MGYDSDHEWYCEFGKCETQPLGFREECHRTAQLIYESTDLVPNILFSGGIDSEVVLRSFRDIGLPFKVSILQFEKGLNLHDISYAIICCESLGIKYDLIQLDIERFMEEEMYEYATKYSCCSPQFPAIMWLGDQVDGLPVLGFGEPYIEKTEIGWHYYEYEKDNALHRHYRMQGRDAVSGFFHYTPEQIYSFLCDEAVTELVSDHRLGKRSTQDVKHEVYSKHFSLMPRPKLNGFEKVRELDEKHRDCLMNDLGLDKFNREMRFEFRQYMKDLVSDLP